MRKFAWLKGLSLSDHGLKHVERVKKDGKWVKVELGTVEYPAKSEKEVFELLHLEYVAPEDRHSGYTASML
jgi:DNA polymerase/3'-5' exonuclease PolX